jgi:3-deoxy-manno-octulosonate cytidylyltransferase (CMP-KDO synthetase)
MSAAIVIPARFGSTRFPGKPLQLVAGISMLERVWRLAKAVPSCARIVIATEDERIASFARSFGAEAVLTSPSCRNGTERVCQAVDKLALADDIILNLQGDAVLTPPWILEALIDELNRSPDVDIATPAIALDAGSLNELRKMKEKSPSSGTTVVFDQFRNALYFSKAIIPFRRSDAHASVHRHIGLYGYRRRGLERFVALAPTPLEMTEGLEQLRALENGLIVRVVVVDYKGRTHGSIDTPDDIPIVESIIAREGDLVATK